MNQSDVRNFLYYLRHNKSISRQQRQKIDMLMARDYVAIASETRKAGAQEPSGTVSVTNTMKFLSLFNKPMGLKYLTHGFDPVEDGRPQDLKALREQCKNIMRDFHDSIPLSLATLLNAYIHGNHKWRDTFGIEHDTAICRDEWIKWSEDEKRHPIDNPEFAKEIMSFRAAVRLASPTSGSCLLQDIVGKASENLLLNIETSRLAMADFYTNTFLLYRTIARILHMMNKRAKDHPDVSVSVRRARDSHGRAIRQIIISQAGSFADKTLEDVVNRLKKNREAGDLGSIRKNMNGYCHWSVESRWDGKPARWNILRDEEATPETEDLEEGAVAGFAHIFTFYIV